MKYYVLQLLVDVFMWDFYKENGIVKVCFF